MDEVINRKENELEKLNQEVNKLENKSYIIVFKNILKLLEDIIVYINLRE